MIMLLLMLIATTLYAQVNLPYNRNVQWVDLVKPATVYVSNPASVSISTPLPTEIVNFPPIQVNISTPLATNVVNFPSVQIVSGTVALNDTLINRVVIRDPTTATRNLSVNTYNGLDVRLVNNVGTLISSTNPLPVNISSATMTLTTTISGTPNVNVVNNPFVQADPYYMAVSTFVSTNVTDSVIKSGSGCVYNIIVGVPGAGSSMILYDGTKVLIELATTQTICIPLQCRFDTNLRITTTGSTPAKITIVYK